MVGVHPETKLVEPAAHLDIETGIASPRSHTPAPVNLKPNLGRGTIRDPSKSLDLSCSVYFSFAQPLLPGFLDHCSCVSPYYRSQLEHHTSAPGLPHEEKLLIKGPPLPQLKYAVHIKTETRSHMIGRASFFSPWKLMIQNGTWGAQTSMSDDTQSRRQPRVID